MTKRRRRTIHMATFEERLAERIQRLQDAAEKERPGSSSRELLMQKAREAETASRMNRWLSSPGLQPPK
jgi:hypothetical protein